MRRALIAILALASGIGAAQAAGWSYSAAPFALLPKGELMYEAKNGSTMVMCSSMDRQARLAVQLEGPWITRMSKDGYRETVMPGKLPPVQVNWSVGAIQGSGRWDMSGGAAIASPADTRTIISALIKGGSLVVSAGKQTVSISGAGAAKALRQIAKQCP